MRDRTSYHQLPETVLLEQARLGDLCHCDFSQTKVIKLWFGRRLSRFHYEAEFEKQFMKFISEKKVLPGSIK